MVQLTEKEMNQLLLVVVGFVHTKEYGVLTREFRELDEAIAKLSLDNPFSVESAFKPYAERLDGLLGELKASIEVIRNDFERDIDSIFGYDSTLANTIRAQLDVVD